MKSFILVSPSLNPYLNLAVENYLVDTLPPHSQLLFLWQNDNTVVIGKNQNPYLECNIEKMQQDNCFLARRLTGGGAVYHDMGNINFSFIMDKESYNVTRQLKVIINALQHFGIVAEYNGRNDIAVSGKKFSGNAFLHKQTNSLHHGTILVTLNTTNMQKYLTASKEKLMAKGVKSTPSRVVNLAQINDKINYESLTKQLIDNYEKEYGTAQILDFGQLKEHKEVAKLQDMLSSHDFLFGKWQPRGETKTVRFDFGCVSINYDKMGRVIDFSTDSLYADINTKVQAMLAKKDIVFDDEKEKQIAHTILDMVQGKL